MSSLNGEVIVCDQHTGPQVSLRVYGDEFYARYESVDGFTVVYDSDQGCYCYATLASGRFVSTGHAAVASPPAEISRHLKEAPEVRNESFGKRYQYLRPREDDHGITTNRTLGPDNGLLTGRRLAEGTIRGLTVIVNFDDVITNITAKDVDEMLNADKYKGNGNYCSVKTYFETVSDGKLTYTNCVVGPISLPKRRSYYIKQLMVKEVMDIVVHSLKVDLSQFDSRKEGIVDAINILYAGDSQYAGDLWPHNSFVSFSYGNIRTHYYQLAGLGVEKIDLRIGTICHENGHLLCRFPDLYDYGKRDGDYEKSQGIGRYCLMGSGNHLNDRRTPAAVCAYLRDLVGWTKTTVGLNDPDRHAVRHGDFSTTYKYHTDKANEYFLVESRLQKGLDSRLPSGGLAVYHCDTLGSNEWEDGTRNRHYQCALLQADGHLDLENNRNAGDSGDLFSDGRGVLISHDTNPSSRDWEGRDSGLIVSDVATDVGGVTFSVGEGPGKGCLQRRVWPNLLLPKVPTETAVNDISIGEKGHSRRVGVELFVVHSAVTMLDVVLKSPGGVEVVLHRGQGRDGEDIDAVWDSDALDALAGVVGVPIQGVWTLSISVRAQVDPGRLIYWGLVLEYE